MFLFADPGWGKTRFAGTSPGRVLIIRPPFEHVDAILPRDRSRVREEVVDDWDGMNVIKDRLRAEGQKYDWVWFDSISGFQDAGLDDLWQTVITEKPHRARYGLDQAEYGINMMRLGQWVRDIVALSDTGMFNFGMTAWPAELQESQDPMRVKRLMPWVQGKNMSSKMCGYMNVVAFGDYTDKGTRILRTSGTDRYFAKDQFDSLQPKGTLLEPTMPKLLAKINAKRPKQPKATVRKTKTKTKK